MRPVPWVLKFCGLVLSLAVLALPAARNAHAGPVDRFHPTPDVGAASGAALPDEAEALLAAHERYRAIVAAGGWPTVPEGPTLVPGEPADPERLTALAERLAAEGDLVGWFGRRGQTAPAEEPIFDAALAEAVRRFQERHGLEVDGKVGPSTLAALAVPARERLDQIALNLERWRTTPTDLPERRIEINLPAYELTTYEQGRPSAVMKVVVGKPTSPTPTFRDRVTHVVLRPYWNVPAGITGRELVPQARRNPGSLAARGFEVQAGGRWVSPTAVDWSRSGYRIRQRPGAGNSLGLVKFVLAGQTLIYLHDTPETRGFLRADRALSHGCVRLERPFDLAEWLLAGEEGWTPERVRRAASSGGERWVPLTEEVPVYVRYFTAWTDEAGRMQFRGDVYREDPAVLARLELREEKQEKVGRAGSRTSASAISSTGE